MKVSLLLVRRLALGLRLEESQILATRNTTILDSQRHQVREVLRIQPILPLDLLALRSLLAVKPPALLA
tara:strand:+ start:200 stop:406 length:207 start_codon:yes stop_codon:yes gene_type:complete